MNSRNPYESSISQSQDGSPANAPRSSARWALVGGLAGAAVPIALGAYGLHRESVYAASLPPGSYGCGMASLGALVVMVGGGPLGGLLGAVTGWIASKIRF